MSLLSDIAYRNVTEKARELTDEAVSYHWSLQDTLATVMEAWLVIVSVSKHLTAVIDGVIHDTYADQRDGTRCVYGYWRKMNGAA